MRSLVAMQHARIALGRKYAAAASAKPRLVLELISDTM